MAEKPNRGKILLQIGDPQLSLMNVKKKNGFQLAMLRKMINDGFEIGEKKGNRRCTKEKIGFLRYLKESELPHYVTPWKRGTVIFLSQKNEK